jgi:hypothetical protein
MSSENLSFGSLPAEGSVGRQGRRLSELLRGIAEDDSRERISIADLLVAMQDRALATLLFVFTFPNCLPLPPGTSIIIGAPAIFLAAQLALGRRPWLPSFITVRSMSRRDFAAVVAKAAPWIARAERLLRPRLSGLSRPPFENVLGVVCVLLTILVFLPIPLSNMLPAFTVCVISLGILERDGAWILAGLVLAVASVAIVWGVVYALVKTALFLLANAFH